MTTLTILLATVANAAEILALQKLAYQSEAERYGDQSIPPLTQTLSEMEDDLRTQVVLKAGIDGEIVASARAYEKDGTAYIGRVIVHPRMQGRGLGKRIMAAIESRFPHARRFELFTGHLSTRNLGFYRSLGYTDFKTVALTPAIQFVYLQKLNPQGAPSRRHSYS
jgi:ribosomal protein S18 acetylase RimI-like enzyme